MYPQLNFSVAIPRPHFMNESVTEGRLKRKFCKLYKNIRPQNYNRRAPLRLQEGSIESLYSLAPWSKSAFIFEKVDFISNYMKGMGH